MRGDSNHWPVPRGDDVDQVMVVSIDGGALNSALWCDTGERYYEVYCTVNLTSKKWELIGKRLLQAILTFRDREDLWRTVPNVLTRAPFQNYIV